MRLRTFQWTTDRHCRLDFNILFLLFKEWFKYKFTSIIVIRKGLNYILESFQYN
jgi:hypothetical protein